MNAGRPTRSHDRLERVSRAMLAIALLAAVAWALWGGQWPDGLLPGRY